MNNKLDDKFIFRISKEEKEIVEEYCKKIRLRPGTFIRNLLMNTVLQEIENENK